MKDPVTLNKIALKANCATSTVSRALRGDTRIKKSTRDHILRIADEIGYTPNPLISALMANLRNDQAHTYHGTLAYIDTLPDPQAVERIHCYHAYYSGAQARAKRLGYKLERIHFNNNALSAKRLESILRNRNIPGLIICYAPDCDHQESPFHLNLDKFSVVSLGAQMDNPPVHCCHTDHYQCAQLAVSKLIKQGFKRIGLVLSEAVDRRLGCKVSAAVVQHTRHLSTQLPPLILKEPKQSDFRQWASSKKPDAILIIEDEFEPWLREYRQAKPTLKKLVHLDWNREREGFCGIDQRNYDVGMRAIDILVEQINFTRVGVPDTALSIVTRGIWRDGEPSELLE